MVDLIPFYQGNENLRVQIIGFRCRIPGVRRQKSEDRREKKRSLEVKKLRGSEGKNRSLEVKRVKRNQAKNSLNPF